MRKRRIAVNSAFLSIALVLTALLVWRAREGQGDEAAVPLEGVRVFCEGEEISALYVAR